MDEETTEAIRDLVAKFVEQELMPLEPSVLERQRTGQSPSLAPEEQRTLHAKARELGLFGLDVPAELGGQDLPVSVMAALAEELGKTAVHFRFAPDSANLRMMVAVGTEAQKRKYLPGLMDGTLKSSIAISEPGAGGDPAAMTTRAELDGDEWIINGRKIWISHAATADFLIVMARVGQGKRHEGITAFIIDKDTPGFVVERKIPMIGDSPTYELVFDNCRIPKSALLGEIGKGYAPMQLRLNIRRIEMAAVALGVAQRAMKMLVDHARDRTTFGVRLADRQAIQWWIADIETRIYQCRLMIRDIASRLDAGQDVRHETGMLKVTSTELSYDAIDHAMQTLGAMGMSTETPLFAFWHAARRARIYEGPSEVHRHAIARRVLARFGG
jgi:acyl-CoA dehydrogenase